MDKAKYSRNTEKEKVIAEILTAPLETDEDYLYLESLVAEEPEADLGGRLNSEKTQRKKIP